MDELDQGGASHSPDQERKPLSGPFADRWRHGGWPHRRRNRWCSISVSREFDRVGLIEFWIANEKEAGYCGKYLFAFDGQQCPAHSHPPNTRRFSCSAAV